MEDSTYSFVRSRRANVFIPNHTHSKYEFVYFFSGKGTLNYEGKTIQFSAGTYYIMESQVVHSELYENTGISLVVQFMPPESLKIPSLVSNVSTLNIKEICTKMREELKNHFYGYDIIVDSHMREIVALIARMMHVKNGKGENTGGIINAILYIDQYFMTDITIDELAKESGYSPDHFRFLFKKQTNTTPKKYILNKRLKLAKKLLKESDLSITEICFRCGFESYSQFMTFFRTRANFTPNEYRNL
ncbi:MAG: AraC family transcriptional regulator [Candidatus Borkfalkiaceae bacterium]|nr:AraC family transcriptional regulator [Clostridia bacterium]MDY6222567.1 AraC family transcriptional regulator [Christensenellaceae bacterium]